MRALRRVLVGSIAAAAMLAAAVPAGAGGGADDQDIADAALLTADDLEGDTAIEEGEFEPNPIPDEDECEPVLDAEDRAADAAEASVSFFDVDTEAVLIEEQVLVFSRAREARRYIDDLSDDDAGICLGDAFVELLGQTEADLAVEPSDLEGGDESIGYIVELSGTDETGEEVTITWEPVFVRVGPAVAYLGFYDIEDGSEVVDVAVELLEEALEDA